MPPPPARDEQRPQVNARYRVRCPRRPTGRSRYRTHRARGWCPASSRGSRRSPRGRGRFRVVSARWSAPCGTRSTRAAAGAVRRKAGPASRTPPQSEHRRRSARHLDMPLEPEGEGVSRWCQRACASAHCGSGIMSLSRKIRMSPEASSAPRFRASAEPAAFLTSHLGADPVGSRRPQRWSDPSSTTTTESSSLG